MYIELCNAKINLHQIFMYSGVAMVLGGSYTLIEKHIFNLLNIKFYKILIVFVVVINIINK